MIRFVCSAFVVILVCAPTPAKEIDNTISLDLRAGKRVSKKTLSLIDQVLASRFMTASCRPEVVEDAEQPALEVDLLVDFWTERGQPSDVTRLNSRTGRYQTQTAFEVEVVYAFAVREPGVEKPVYERRKIERYVAHPNRSDLFDPRQTAIDRVHLQMTKHISSVICKQLKSLAKRKRRAAKD